MTLGATLALPMDIKSLMVLIVLHLSVMVCLLIISTRLILVRFSESAFSASMMFIRDSLTPANTMCGSTYYY
jgi:hypothetical protein